MAYAGCLAATSGCSIAQTAVCFATKLRGSGNPTSGAQNKRRTCGAAGVCAVAISGIKPDRALIFFVGITVVSRRLGSGNAREKIWGPEQASRNGSPALNGLYGL